MTRIFNRHGEYEELLNEHLDGRLDAGQEAKFRAHLAECRRCQAELRQMEEIAAVLHAQPMMEPPRSFALPLTTSQQSGARERSARNGANPGFLRWAGGGTLGLLRSLQVATAAAALALVALVGLDVMGVVAPEPSPGISQVHEPQIAADPDGERMTEFEGTNEGQEMMPLGVPPGPDSEPPPIPTDPSMPPDAKAPSTAGEPVPPPADAGAAESAARSAVEWLKLGLSALTAALALGVVGLTWQIYRHSI